jgi:predicted PurR-regulated permease PerM
LVYVLISPIIIDNFFKIGHLDVNNIINGLQSFFIDLQTNIRILNNVDLMGLSQDILKNVTNYFSTNNINNIVQSILGLTSSVYAYLMGFIVSIYLIVSKEELFKATNKFFEAILNERQFVITKKYFLLFEKTFKRFFFGKMLDSLIIGIIAFFGLWILKVPFYSLLALLIGITNMIPYFGPFIGGIPAVIVTLFITGNPINALVCGLFVLVLQQFDGLYLGPKILGKAVKISSVWVLIAIIIGGALFRVTGLLLCVPFAATFKEGFDEFYKYRMKKKAVFQKKEYLRNKQSESE